jgi:hypothetical protein
MIRKNKMDDSNIEKDNDIQKGWCSAAAVDEWRIVPRVLMIMYAISFYRATEWFMQLPDPTNSQSAFVSVIVGAGAAWFGLYVGSGNKK